METINIEDVDHPDFVALDKDEQVVLVGEVKGFPFNFKEKKVQEYAIGRLINYLQAAKILIPFAMLVDVENIIIFKWDGKNFIESNICLNTAEVLNHYEPEFSKK
ncbi:hypothetical protein [Scytonema sp. NUACC26]|uniref:hypothetical protein n=1 Tax=Scytonema sp. NUACC26 TaxID=3140176 RepID=UPI0034DBDB96